nr:HepT-like ribonuclease domain-containing protein [Haloferax larsenii]
MGFPRLQPREDVNGAQTMNTLVASIGFRNVLAHEYGHVDAGEVYESLQTGLGVYTTYSQQIAQWVQSHP